MPFLPTSGKHYYKSLSAQSQGEKNISKVKGGSGHGRTMSKYYQEAKA
jgi:hypothetical protein